MPDMMVEGGRLYYPPEDSNNPDDRKVYHPETNSQVVLMDSGRSLEDALNGGIVISSEKPDYRCLWGKVTKVTEE